MYFIIYSINIYITVEGDCMDLLELQVEAAKSEKSYAIITVVETEGRTSFEVGKKILLYQNGEMFGTVGGGALEAKIIEEAKNAMSNQKSLLKSFEHIPDYEDKGLGCHFKATVFIEVFSPKPHLIVCGGGHVGIALLELSKFVGFNTTLIDIRDNTTNMNFIDNFYRSETYAKGVGTVGFKENAFYVCSASTHTQDKSALGEIMKLDFRYVGMLGSIEKAENLFNQLEEDGISREKLNKVYTPIGLNISDSSPSEIAVSIMAEMLLVKNNKVLMHRKRTDK